MISPQEVDDLHDNPFGKGWDLAILAMRMEAQGEFTQGEMKFRMTFKTDSNGKETQKELAEK